MYETTGNDKTSTYNLLLKTLKKLGIYRMNQYAHGPEDFQLRVKYFAHEPKPSSAPLMSSVINHVKLYILIVYIIVLLFN